MNDTQPDTKQILSDLAAVREAQYQTLTKLYGRATEREAKLIAERDALRAAASDVLDWYDHGDGEIGEIMAALRDALVKSDER